MPLLTIGILVTCVYVCIRFFIKPYLYWKGRNVPHVKPVPVFGNLACFVFQKCNLAQCIQEIYSSHPQARYVGFHKFLQPALLIKDPELIKSITVKDWHCFPQHDLVVSEGVDPLWGNSIVAMEGNERWRQMRSILSCAFTSTKLKKMLSLLKICSNQFIEHFETEKHIIRIDIKEMFSRYANDVIGTIAFGFNCNSFRQPENDFYLMGKLATNFEGIRALKFFLNGLSSNLMEIFNIGIYSKSIRTFFCNTIRNTLEMRRKYNILRQDMISLMMEAKQRGICDDKVDVPSMKNVNPDAIVKKLDINNDVITAQALIFFIGGFETTATVMSFAAYELACNLHVQRTLYKEITVAYDECNGNINYKALMGLTYLDMVISETLRKWPPILVSDRAVVKKFTYTPEENATEPLTIDKGVCCAIPIFSIHRDPKYYPDPEKFDPERFNNKNKISIPPYAYIPFGSGPRSCIGSRFALLEMKLIIAEIIYKYEIVTTSETEIPIKLSPSSFLLRPSNGMKLGLQPRRHS